MREQDHDNPPEANGGGTEGLDEVFVLADARPIGNRGRRPIRDGTALNSLHEIADDYDIAYSRTGPGGGGIGFARSTGVTGGGSGYGYEA